MFWSVGKEIGSFELYVTKSSDLVFPWKTRCFNLHNTENIFWLVGNEIGFFECYIAKKKSVFLFYLLKNVALTQKTCLCLFTVSILPVCRFDFTQNDVFSSVWLSDNGFATFWWRDALFSIILLRTASIPLFPF